MRLSQKKTISKLFFPFYTSFYVLYIENVVNIRNVSTRLNFYWIWVRTNVQFDRKLCVFLKLNIKGTYPDDIIVCLGLFMSSFHWNERTFICHRCGFCDCVVAFIGSIWCLHMQRSPIVNFIDERSWIECARVAWIAIVTMWWLTRTWPIQGCVKEEKTDGEFHCKHEQCQISLQTNTQQLFFQFIYIYFIVAHFSGW